jgi:hypothetical protein
MGNMQFEMGRGEFVEALSCAVGTVLDRKRGPAQDVRIQALKGGTAEITAHNWRGDSFSGTYSAEVSVPGETSVKARDALECLKGSPRSGKVLIIGSEEASLRIVEDTGYSEINVSDSSESPGAGSDWGKTRESARSGWRVDGRKLKSLLEKMLRIKSDREDYRTWPHNVFFRIERARLAGHLCACSTTGSILTKGTIAAFGNGAEGTRQRAEFLVAKSSLQRVKCHFFTKGAVNFGIGSTDSNFVLYRGGAGDVISERVYLKKAEGKYGLKQKEAAPYSGIGLPPDRPQCTGFPPFEKALSAEKEGYEWVVVDTKSIVSTLKSRTKTEKNRIFTLSTSGIGAGELFIPAKTEHDAVADAGAKVDIKLDLELFTTGMRNIKENTVRIGFKERNKAVFIRSDKDQSFVTLIMPRAS